MQRGDLISTAYDNAAVPPFCWSLVFCFGMKLIFLNFALCCKEQFQVAANLPIELNLRFLVLRLAFQKQRNIAVKGKGTKNLEGKK